MLTKADQDRADQRVRERRDGELVLKFMGYSPDLMDQQLQLGKDEIFTPGQNDLVIYNLKIKEFSKL